MALHAPAQGLLHQVGDLFTADRHVGEPLAGQQQLGGEGIGFLLPLAPEASAVFAVAKGGLGDFYPFRRGHRLVGGEGDGKAIEQVVAHLALFGVVGGDQQRGAGMGQAQALPFHPVFPSPHRRQQQVEGVGIEQV